MSDDLDDLFARGRAGDKKAEEKLFRYLLVRFQVIAKRRVGDAEAAKDITADACATALQKYKVENIRNPAAWLYKILQHKIGNYWSKKKNLESQVEPDKVIERTADDPNGVDRMTLVKCFRRLIKRNRTYARVLNLVHQGYKTDEICQRFKITANNLYVILSRARGLLKSCIERGVM
jgi:RNA polymerase sigma-70 factor (ECF subfamily)